MASSTLVTPSQRSTGMRECGSAKGEGVAVGVGLDDSEKFDVGSYLAAEKAEVVFKGLGANLNPAGARWHGSVQGSVYGIAVEGLRRILV